jgi:peptidoglycan/xylan/chitin deacetylase (PgdA/CDA1 family)
MEEGRSHSCISVSAYEKQKRPMKIPILMYHSISCTYMARFRAFVVSPAVFAEQMAYLYQQGYTPITVTHLVNARSNARTVLPERPVVLTFDDGFADFFTNALPVLKQYHFTATLYISTACVGATSRWLRRERETSRPMLTWEQVAEISSSGIECGAHTHSHPQLDTLKVYRVKDEIERSKELLEDHLRQDILSFAYPFGYFTARVRQQVREAGFRSACAFRHAMSTENDDPFSLARLMVSESTSMEAFAALITGHSGSLSTTLYTLYARMRTPSWQLIRRSFATMKRHVNEQQQEEWTQ